MTLTDDYYDYFDSEIKKIAIITQDKISASQSNEYIIIMLNTVITDANGSSCNGIPISWRNSIQNQVVIKNLVRFIRSLLTFTLRLSNHCYVFFYLSLRGLDVVGGCGLERPVVREFTVFKNIENQNSLKTFVIPECLHSTYDQERKFKTTIPNP